MEEIAEARIHLLRHAKSEWGCFGVLFDESGLPFVVTLENEKTLIPPSTEGYSCYPSVYHKGGYPTFEIIVPGHSRLLFHKLNFDYQSEGCIGVAEAYQIIGGRPAVAESDKGFTEFWTKYKNFQRLKLTVEEHIIQPYKRAA